MSRLTWCDSCAAVIDLEDGWDYGDGEGLYCLACQDAHFADGIAMATEHAADLDAAKTICRRCGQEMNDRDESEGCEDFACPMQEPV
jgi:hypothetical protein